MMIRHLAAYALGSAMGIFVRVLGALSWVVKFTNHGVRP